MAKLIAFEGVDGAGKTSLIEALGEKLKASGYNVKSSRLVEDVIDFYKDWDLEADFKRGAYQHRIADQERAEIFAVEAYLKAKQYRASDFDFVLLDRWFPIADYDLLTPTNFKLQSTQQFLKSLGNPDLMICMDVSVETSIERLKMKSDWMIDFYSEDALLKVISELREKHLRKFDRFIGAKFKLDAELPIETLCLELFDFISY